MIKMQGQNMFHAGDKWRCRDRSIVTIHCVINGDEQPIVAVTEDKKIRRYNPEGFFEGPKDYHDFDLIGLNKKAEK